MIFGPLSLWLGVAAVAAITLAAIALALRGDQRTRDMWLSAAGVFALVLGASLLAVARWAYDHPYWDQLVEGTDWYRPFAARNFTWAQLFEVWNDHRIALTRMWALMILSLAHVWDNRVQAVWNTLLHALPAAMLVAFLAPRLKPWERLPVTIMIALPVALPLAIQNVTWGFQSQFYFLLLFTPLALWLLTGDRLRGAALVLGAACLALCLLSVASGMLCALALLCTAILEALRAPSARRGHLGLLVVSASMLAMGWLIGRHRHFDTTAARVLEALGCALAYPFVTRAWIAPLMWVPGVWWLVSLMRRRGPFDRLERFMVALGAFVALNALAIAWARSFFQIVPATRYYDLLALGLVFNVLAALRVHRLVLAAWLVLALGGTLWLYRHVLEVEWPLWHFLSNDRAANGMRGYLETGDASRLEWLAHEKNMPRFNREGMAAMLDDPYIRTILPPSVRPGGSTDLPARLRAVGAALLSLGAITWLAATALSLRRRRHE